MGFGGVRLYHGKLRIAPHLPKAWSKLSYAVYWQGSRLRVTIEGGSATLINEGKPVSGLLIDGCDRSIGSGETIRWDC